MDHQLGSPEGIGKEAAETQGIVGCQTGIPADGGQLGDLAVQV
jgi:hypothetical protein